jgi:hypothetical protein
MSRGIGSGRQWDHGEVQEFGPLADPSLQRENQIRTITEFLICAVWNATGAFVVALRFRRLNTGFIRRCLRQIRGFSACTPFLLVYFLYWGHRLGLKVTILWFQIVVPFGLIMSRFIRP